MPHRNPDGTFASSETGSYDNYEIQTIVTGLQTDEVNITDALEKFPQFNTFEPLGGLARNEVAELVSMTGLAAVGIPATSDAAAGTQAYVHSELSLDPETSTMPILAGDVTESDKDGVTGVDARNVSITDPDTVHSHSLYAEARSLDDTNGSGAGGTGDTLEYQTAFRPLFGHGPTVDRHDNLFVHLGYDSAGTAQPRLKYYDKMTLVWDVREE